MTRMEKLAYLLEDVFGASVFWDEDKLVIESV